MDAIRTSDLTKVFGSHVAVDHISLTVASGSLFGLLGPNGSGKTTTMKLLMGEYTPSEGSSHVLDISSADALEIKKQVGVIPEQETPPSFLTAHEYLLFVANIRNLQTRVIDEWVDRFKLSGELHTLCKDLSRGTRQKLMFAQAFMHKPKLAFIDEPLINLDPIAQKIVKDFLVEYVNQGNTVFLSTHVLSVAEEICTDVAVLNNGKLVFSGSVHELRDKRQRLEEVFLDLVS